MQARLFHLHALSALHCGTGRSAGVVDLPIARARATQLPIVPGSSLRGVLREQVTKRPGADAETLFGPRTIRSDQGAFAGALSIGDAHLLALPVRCLAGVVSFVTCPFILRRHKRDLERADASPPALPREPDKGAAQVTPQSVNLVEPKSRKLVLEDLDLQAHTDDALVPWAQRIARAVHPGDDDAQTDVVARLALVSDDVMSFLAETATDVRARIRLDPKTGTVARGALLVRRTPAPRDRALGRLRRGGFPQAGRPAHGGRPRAHGTGRRVAAARRQRRRRQRPGPLSHRRGAGMKVRAHTVARAAYECVAGRRDETKNRQGVDNKKYGALAHKLPGMILENGLAQATGFLLAKGDREHLDLLDDLRVVLRATETTTAGGGAGLHQEIIDSDLERTLMLTPGRCKPAAG